MKSPVSLVRLFIVALVALGLISPLAAPAAAAQEAQEAGELRITVVDDWGNPVEGACLELDDYRWYIAQACTDWSGQASFSGLAIGDFYTVTMIQAPAGYLASEPTTITMMQSVQELTLVVTEDYLVPPTEGGLDISVVDESGNPVEGACLELHDASGNWMDYLCTDVYGRGYFAGLPVGEYTVTMVRAPAGYLVSNPATVMVDTDAVQTLTLVAPTAGPAPDSGDLHIYILDIDDPADWKHPAGACFALWDAAGTLAASACDEDDAAMGTFFSALPVGEYTVEMVQTPAGYLTPEPMVLTVVGGFQEETVVVTADPNAPQTENTPTGTNVTVELDSATTITFDNVIQAGETTVTATSTAPELPSGYLQVGTLFYDVATTAVFDGLATICFAYDPTTTDGGSLSLLHYENGAWVDVTTSNDTANGQICGQVTSFSPFAIAPQTATTSEPGTGAIEVLVTSGEGGSPVVGERVEIQAAQWVISSCITGSDGHCIVEASSFMYQPSEGESVVALVNLGYQGAFYAPTVAYDSTALNQLTVVAPLPLSAAPAGTAGNVEMVVTDGGSPVASTWAGVYTAASDQAIGSCKTDMNGTCVIAWHTESPAAGEQLRGLLLTYAPDEGWVTYDPSVVNTLTIAVGSMEGPTPDPYAPEPMTLTQWAMLAGATGWQPIDEAREGDTVTFYFQVSDFTEAGLTGVSVVTDRFGTICEGRSVAPREWTICEYTYTVTAEDAAAGRIEFATTASADGHEPTGYAFPLRVVSATDTPNPGGELQIFVVDEVGNLVAGACLVVVSDTDGTLMGSACTDAAGGAYFSGLITGDIYTVEMGQPPAGYLAAGPQTIVMEDGGVALTMVVSTEAPPPPPGYTESGSNVTVQPSADTTVTFGEVTQAGETTVTATDAYTAPDLPTNFSLDGALFYDVHTTAIFSGSATICFAYDPAAFTDPSSLSLLHYEEGIGWVDVTTSNDTVAGQICGSVTSFSPFAIASAAMTVDGFYAPVEMVSGVANVVKGGATVPLKFNVYQGSTEVTDLAAVTVTITQTACTAGSTDTVEGVSLTASGTALRYAGTPGIDGQFVQNWKTPKVSVTTCYTVTATATGGAAVTALFQLKP